MGVACHWLSSNPRTFWSPFKRTRCALAGIGRGSLIRLLPRCARKQQAQHSDIRKTKGGGLKCLPCWVPANNSEVMTGATSGSRTGKGMACRMEEAAWQPAWTGATLITHCVLVAICGAVGAILRDSAATEARPPGRRDTHPAGQHVYGCCQPWRPGSQ